MKAWITAIVLAVAAAAAAFVSTKDRFDYYILSLSWTPSWCAEAGDARDAAQCEAGRGYGFTLHGLWPQYERGGWPADCRSESDPPTRADTAAMADIMGDAGLARHEWRRHGTCTGLSPQDYFKASRQAYDAVVRPASLRQRGGSGHAYPSEIEAAFLSANPGLEPDQITVTCKSNRIQEVRICLTKDLRWRDCAPDTRRDCTTPGAGFQPIR